MDVFIEKIVGRKKRIEDHLFIAGLVTIGIIAFFAVFAIPILSGFAPILAAGIIFCVYYFAKSRNIEFEYAVTNGDLDIDKIISQRKRKRVFSANCKDFDVVAKVGSQQYTHEVRNMKNRLEAVSSMDAPGVYFITLTYKGEKMVVFFEPDERMLNSFKTFIPRKVFI